MRIPGLSCVVFIGVVVAGGLATSRAEDGDGLTMRIVPVGALTRGRTQFLREQPPIISPDQVSDERSPLFGNEGYEPVLPVGTIDELAAIAMSNVEPGFWDQREGASIRALAEHALVVRATPDVHAAVLRYVTELERAHAGTILLDVACVKQDALEARDLLRGGGGLTLSDDQAATLLEGHGAGPALTLVAFSGQRVASYTGLQIPYVQDHDVEVAEDSFQSDPIVGVANAGLAVDVLGRTSPDDGKVLIGLDAFLAERIEMRTAPTEKNGPMQMPAFDVTRVHTVVRAPPGAWVLGDGKASADGDGAWLFLVRARVGSTAPSPRPGQGTELGKTLRVERGPLEHRTFGVHHLGAAVRSIPGPTVYVVPSNYTPPEPPELPEPYPAIAPEAVVELLLESIGYDVWEAPASIEARNGVLLARNRPAVLAAITERLAALRRDVLWTLVTTADVVDVPEPMARTWMSEGRAGSSSVELDARQMEALEAALAKGDARLLESVRVTSFRGTRNTARSGREIAYVQDYEVEIAQSSNIGNPVVQAVFAGAQLDLAGDLSLDRSTVHLDLRFVRSELEAGGRSGPSRFTTVHGDVELPELRIQRLRTGLTAAVGRTIVAGSWKAHDRRIFLLLTPRLR